MGGEVGPIFFHQDCVQCTHTTSKHNPWMSRLRCCTIFFSEEKRDWALNSYCHDWRNYVESFYWWRSIDMWWSYYSMHVRIYDYVDYLEIHFFVLSQICTLLQRKSGKKKNSHTTNVQIVTWNKSLIGLQFWLVHFTISSSTVRKKAVVVLITRLNSSFISIFRKPIYIEVGI